MIILAPLQGYTDYVFRNAYRRHFSGIDLAIAPFVSLVKGKKVKLTHLRDLLPENNGSMKIIPQVMGNDPEMFLTMAESLRELGYDSINWNLGCPVQAIARKKRGSGMLPYPEMIEDILSSILPKIKMKFSIKTRLGYHSLEEADGIMGVYNQYPLDFLVVHPRLGSQMYEGEVHYQAFNKLLAKAKMPLIYSGDIWTPAIYKDLRSRYPEVNGWMLGRGIFRDLFLAEKISGNFKPEQAKDKFWAFQFDLLEALQEKMLREKNVLNKMKEYWSMWGEMFEEHDTIKPGILSVQKLEKLYQVLNNIREQYNLQFG